MIKENSFEACMEKVAQNCDIIGRPLFMVLDKEKVECGFC